RRATLLAYNPSTGRREPARDFAEYDELQRRKAAGEPLTQVLVKAEEGEAEYDPAAYAPSEGTNAD
ncbi:hypothetical protein JCM10207_004421, partial [Rhodosporidiobolus poonsookiae]